MKKLIYLVQKKVQVYLSSVDYRFVMIDVVKVFTSKKKAINYIANQDTPNNTHYVILARELA